MAPQDAAQQPEVSVIVPARNAAGLLPRLFAALDRSTFPGAWETIVVDDASTDATAEIAEGRGARVVRLSSQSGPAAARNAGLAAARARLIAFTDADCEPSAAWLSAITQALADADIATGPVSPVPGAPRDAFARTVLIGSESPLFQTANLAIRREVAERVGGFEAFIPVEQGHFGEDAVFAWRARRTGARTVFAEDALVHHAVFPRGAREFIAEHWRRRFFPALVRELPELRSHLPLRYFLTRDTALFDLALLGVGASVVSRRRGALLAALPYLKRRLTWRRPAVRENLAFVAADVVSFTALVRGSAAARRLLL